MIWHWVEAFAAAVMVLMGGYSVRWDSPAWLRLAAAGYCAVGAFASVLGYRPAVFTWCWVAAGGAWLLMFWSATRRAARRAAQAAADLAAQQKWERWQATCRENGWPT